MKNELNELLNKKIDNDINYQLNEEQLKELDNICNFIMYLKDKIANVCSEERSDIEIGYELGYLNKEVSKNHIKLINIIENINEL